MAAEPGVDASELPHTPPTPPGQAQGTFQVSEGFRMDLVAAEPLVADPIAMAFDASGRLFVVEMRGYSERQTEHLGRIRLLEDTDGDGIFDHSQIFADQLDWPTAVICAQGGVFVGVNPDILFLKDNDGDGRADQREKVFTGFGHKVSRLNVQALLNSFTWGLDQRIHGATSFNGASAIPANSPKATPLLLRGRDFSFDPLRLDLRAESGGGQHGLSFDDEGRKFICSNSRHIQQVIYEDLYSSRISYPPLPSPLADIAAEGPAAEVFRISADEPWRVVRTRWRIAGLVGGPVEGGGRVSGYFTAATGITVFRGHAWPKSHQGDVFIGDVGSNLIHRKKFSPNPPTVAQLASRTVAETDHEFVASTDNWFRPVQMANGPDGCLYVADMYREIIEHPWSLPPAIKQHLDLNNGNNRGRIYRITPDDFVQPEKPRLHQATTRDLVAALSHPNGWHRDTASRLLCEQRDPAAIPGLRKVIHSSESAPARLHSLYILKNLQGLRLDDIQHALKDPQAAVRVHAIRLAPGALKAQSSFTRSFWQRLLAMSKDPDPEVRFQLALVLGDFVDEKRIPKLVELARQDHADPWTGKAILSSLAVSKAPTKPSAAFQAWSALVNDPALTGTEPGRAWLGQLTALTGFVADLSEISRVLRQLSSLQDLTLVSSLINSFHQGIRKSGRSLARPMAPEAWDTLSTRALKALSDPSQPERLRLSGLEIIGLTPAINQAASDTLASLWQQEKTETIRNAALNAYLNLPGRQPAQAVVNRWSELPAESRPLVIDAMLQSKLRCEMLLAAFASKTIQPDDLSLSQKTRLRNHSDKGIQQRAGAILGPAPSPAGPASLEDHPQALQLAGQPSSGKTHFVERCASCHQLAGEGHDLGPDLVTIRNAGKEKILLNILDPNREVAPNYVAYEIATRDDESLSGIIARETTTTITLRQANGIETQLPRTQVRSMQSRGQSLMPEGLTQGMKDQDIADLLAFLLQEK